jgi:hypothetical protein
MKLKGFRIGVGGGGEKKKEKVLDATHATADYHEWR